MLSLLSSRPTRDSASPAKVPAKPACSCLWVPPADASLQSRAYGWFKSAADRCAALALFVSTLPMMLAAALAVKLTSRGPALYSQIRLGRHGRPYWIYKFRSMYLDCEARSGAQWCKLNDPRVTPLGRFMRKLHIDELPQLWNVLRGDMSLVGPRPERPEFAVSLDESLPGYRGRLAVKPGVTGLAQIQLPSDTSIESVRDKLVLDLCYVERYGPSLDIRILVGTALYLLGVSYAGVRRLLALPTGQTSEVVVLQTLPEPG
jgi:lipopolysaccharide/colanic/teichoic acid biosynthesis glycosyltransferase